MGEVDEQMIDLTNQTFTVENLYELRGHIKALEDDDGWIRVNKNTAISMINQLIKLTKEARCEYRDTENNSK